MITLTPIPPVDIPLKVYSPDDYPPPEEQLSQKAATLPDWLSTAPTPQEQTRLPDLPRTKEHVLLEQQIFETFFERFVDAVTVNDNPLKLVEDDPRGINLGRFLRWIRKNPEYNARFEEALEISADVAVWQNDIIALGQDSLEDIERSRMRIKQNEFRATKLNRKRYGESKQVDITTNVTYDFRAALEKREEQLRALEGEYRVVNG